MKKRSKYVLLYAAATLAILLSSFGVFLIAKPYFFAVPNQVLLNPNSASRSFNPTQATLGLPQEVLVTIVPDSGAILNDVVEIIPTIFYVTYNAGAIARPDIGQNAIQFLGFSPTTQTHAYTIMPNQTICDSGQTNFTYSGLILEPPYRPIALPGQTNVELNTGQIVRKLQAEVLISNTISVALTVLPSCGQNAMNVSEIVPAGWVVLSAAGGQINGNTINWSIACAGNCTPTTLSYSVQSPSSTGNAVFNGTYEFYVSGTSQGIKLVSGNQNVQIVNVDCTTSCVSNPAACAGESCGANSICRNSTCAGSCTGSGLSCRPFCNGNFVSYPAGDGVCGPSVCCHQQPTCQSLGGICMSHVPQFCPAGYVHLPTGDTSCNGGVIPEGQYSENYCCQSP